MGGMQGKQGTETTTLQVTTKSVATEGRLGKKEKVLKMSSPRGLKRDGGPGCP